MRTLRNLLKHELIGLEVEVLESRNVYEKGIKGEIVDETRNTLVIKTRRSDKMIQKDGRKFMITLDGKHIVVDGSAIVGRPEDRIKRKVKRWC